MKQYQTRKEILLDLHVLLDATRRGWLQGMAVQHMTRLMIISGDMMRRKSGGKIRKVLADTYKAWLEAAEKADSRGSDTIICNSDQYKLAVQHIRNFTKAVEHMSDRDLLISQRYVDAEVK